MTGRTDDRDAGPAADREMRLPTVAGDTAGEVEVSGGAGGGSAVRRVDVSAFRLILTLAVAGGLAGLIIVLVHQWSRPRIEAHQARVLQEAIFEVLGGPDRYETAFLVDGSFTTQPPVSADTAALERVYVGYDGGGRPVGVAVAGAEPGFQDVIRLIFGYRPDSGEVVGMKILESKETPGLGDKIEKDSAFVDEFAGVAAPLEGVKAGRAGGTPNEVDMITGATISSKAVIDIINHRLEGLAVPIGQFWAGGAMASRQGGRDVASGRTVTGGDR